MRCFGLLFEAEADAWPQRNCWVYRDFSPDTNCGFGTELPKHQPCHHKRARCFGNLVPQNEQRAGNVIPNDRHVIPNAVRNLL